ncbi:MAG: hypothetical protein KDA72_11065 [Planctomycetales bacterium]|nr:hypothetical protein [Planctomycetales bacterium]
MTREPVSAARVYYLPYLSNEVAQALPEFDEDGNVDGDQQRYQTDRNGEFRLVGLPGPAIVGARSVLKTYRHGSGYEQLTGPKHETEEHALTWRNPIWVGPKWPDTMREINPSEDEAILSLDLEMDPGESVPITVVDQAGEPVIGAKLRGLLETNGSTVETQSKEYAVVNLGPDEERVITVHHEARNIGLVATISSIDEAPRRIELLPCARISGKLTKDGVPLPGLSIRATILPGGDFAPVLDRQFITDIDGHFADVLLPGCEYSLGAVGQGLDHYATVVTDLTIEPGQSIELGTLELSDDQKFVSVAKSSAQSDSLAERVYVAGKVLDQAGKPIENATVFVGFPKSEGKDRGVRASPPIKTISAKDGTFTTSYVLGELFEGADQISHGSWQQIPREIYVAALADGMSPDWRTLSDFAAGEPLTLQLAASRSLVGRLITLEGNAVPGVNVRLKSIASAMNQNIELWLASLRGGDEIGQASREHKLRYLRPELLDRQTEFTTDALGRFEIPNIGQDQVATLVVTAPGFARQVIRMIARELEPMSTNSVANHLESTMLYGEEASAIVVAPSQAIVGIVRDATTKEPLAGVAVDSARIAGSNSIGSRTEIVSSVTDENGRYQLEGLPKGKGNVVLAVPNDDQPYFMREVPVPIEDGMQPITLDIELSRGFWLTGKVVDSESGEPVSSSLKYFPFLDNKSANLALGFTGSGFMDACFSYQARYQTKSDGSFRIVVLPGRAIVGAETYGGSSASYQKGIGSQNISGLNDDGTFATYRNPFVASNKFPNVMVEVDVPDTGGVADILLKAVPGVPVKVRIADGNGKPVTGFDVNGISFSSQWNRKLEISEFEVTGLGPHDSRTILILHEELGIGKAFRITPELDRTQVVDIRLEPLIAVCGHIVDENDAPISNAQMSALTQPLEDYNPQLDAVTTDYDGRFQFTSIPAGVAYRIEGWTHGKSLKQFQQIDFEAQAGQEIDVGSYRADADGELMSLGAQP